MFQQLTGHLNGNVRDCDVNHIRCGFVVRPTQSHFQPTLGSHESQMDGINDAWGNYWLCTWDLTPW